MNLPIIVLLLIFLLLSLIFIARPLILIAESFISLIISFFITFFCFSPIMNLLKTMGVSENVYTPSIIFILIIIVSWAFLFTLLSMTLNFGQVIKSYKSKLFLFIFSVGFTLVIGIIACLSITPFIQSQKVLDEINDCFLCKFINSFEDLPLDESLSRLPLDIYMPENNNKAFRLTANYEVQAINTDATKRAFELINKQRTENNIKELEWDSKLEKLASEYGVKISNTGYFSHIDQDSKTVKERARDLGLKYNYLGENLAIAPKLDTAYFALVESESHLKNMISPLFTEGATAVFDLKNGYIMLIQIFAN